MLPPKKLFTPAVILSFFISINLLQALPKNDEGINAFCNQNYTKAIELLSSAANNGDEKALYYIGQSYGKLEKPSKAQRYLKKSSSKGYLPATFKLGKNLYEGKQVKQNKKKGLKYIKTAADKGLPQAQMYYYQITPVSAKTVAMLAHASKTDVLALELLTQLYTNKSPYVNADYDTTFDLKHRLIEMEADNAHYVFLLAEHTFNDREIAATVSVTPQTAAQISDLFVNGHSLPKSYMHAISWIEIACTKSPIPRYDYISRFIQLAQALNYDQNNLPPDLIGVLSYVFYKGTDNIYINLKRAKKWTQMAVAIDLAPHYRIWLEDINKRLAENPDIMPYRKINKKIIPPESIADNPKALSDYYAELGEPHINETFLYTIKTLQQKKLPADLKKYVLRLLKTQEKMQLPDLMLPVDIINLMAEISYNGMGNMKPNKLTAPGWTSLAVQKATTIKAGRKYQMRMMKMGAQMPGSLEKPVPPPPTREPHPAN